jgi:hypothetical protein
MSFVPPNLPSGPDHGPGDAPVLSGAPAGREVHLTLEDLPDDCTSIILSMVQGKVPGEVR